jgi:hypothetical protein
MAQGPTLLGWYVCEWPPDVNPLTQSVTMGLVRIFFDGQFESSGR